MLVRYVHAYLLFETSGVSKIIDYGCGHTVYSRYLMQVLSERLSMIWWEGLRNDDSETVVGFISRVKYHKAQGKGDKERVDEETINSSLRVFIWNRLLLLLIP